MPRPFTRAFYLFFIFLSVHGGNSFSQSTDKNFILARTYKLPRTTVSDKIQDASQDVSYIDGLGRPLQSISAHASPQLSGSTPNDLVSHTEYDAYGRVSKVYAPSPMNGSGGFQAVTNVITNAVNYYNSSSNFSQPNDRVYTLTEYEPSPLNRVRKQFAVGSDRAVDISYGVNGSNEIKRYVVSGNGVTEDGTYGANQLTFVRTADENNNEAKEFKDKNGRVILKASNAGNGDWLNTFYVYDDFSQLRFVLQPQYQVESNTDKYAFRYQYNEKGLLTSKYVPGGGTTTMAYDERDRLKESTDGKGRTTYFKYDDLNRVIETGERIVTTENPLVKTHYDNYSPSFGAAAGFSNELGDYPGGNRSNIKGKVTFTATRVLYADGNYNANDAWMYTTTYYDDRFNVIQTTRSLYDIGGTSFERTTRQLRFDGRVEKELILQSVGTGNHSVEKIYSYDHADRPLSTRYVVRSDNAIKKDIVLSANRYDALGQLKTKFLYSPSPSDDKFREQLDYTYVPRSWMSKVTGKTSVGDNFGVELKYGNPSQASQQFNGNIAEMTWRQGGGTWVGYKFTYDEAKRLKNAEGLTYGFQERISEYDKNGNIKYLQRYNGTTKWDDLTYEYNGNQLTKVTDSGNSDGFNNGSSASGDDYSYDGVGNATRDANRGIGNDGIAYNFLNLPRQVGINGNTVQYFYDATGNKLRMQNGGTNTKYAGAFEYNDQNYLTRIATEEGQINVTSNGAAIGDYSFEYYLRDHQGNTRMVINEAGTMVQETEYFPFGLAIPRTAGSNKYKFLGKETQPETKWIDLQARFFDPTIGRFMSVDPETEGQLEFSPYHYSYNNPIRFSDPDGRFPECCGGVGDFLTGVGQAFTEDFVGAASPIKASPGYVGAYNSGRTAGHYAAMVVGATEVAGGIIGDVGAVVGEIGSVGIATPVAVPLAAASTTAILHGTAMGAKAAENLRNDKGRVNADGLQGARDAQKATLKGRAPKEIDRVDIPKLDPNGKPLHGQQPHAHIKDKSKVAVNQDGSYKHGDKPLTQKVTDWLKNHGWNL